MKTSHSLAIDGLSRGSATGSGSFAPANKISAPAQLKTAARSVHRQAQRSQTLMRGAVKKPAKAEELASVVTQPKARTATPTGSRVTNARFTTKNSHINRFGHISTPRFSRSSVNKKQPTSRNGSTPKPSSARAQNSVLNKPLPSMVTSVSHQRLERMLDEALIRADSHKQARLGRANAGFRQKIKSMPRWLSLGAPVLLLVIAGVYVALQKVPQVAMSVAATKAHVNAHVPTYTPSGFSLATPVQYTNGSVTVKYRATDNSGRSYTLTQKTSNMDNQSLAETVVPQDAQVQTSQVDGTTVYIYGHNNAAWVNHGVQYLINDTARLNSNQILNIAGSL